MSFPKRRRLEPHARRQEIIEAAERLLIERGAEIRVEDVVREAGAAKGTFYLYFPTWDDLLDTIRQRIFEAFDRAHPMPDTVDAAVDWLALLDRLAVAFVDATVELGGMHDAIFHSDFAQRRAIPAADHPVNRLTDLIRSGERAGTLAAVDPEPTARLLFAVIHETADAVAEGQDRQRALAAMRRMLRQSLEAKP